MRGRKDLGGSAILVEVIVRQVPEYIKLEALSHVWLPGIGNHGRPIAWSMPDGANDWVGCTDQRRDTHNVLKSANHHSRSLPIFIRRDQDLLSIYEALEEDGKWKRVYRIQGVYLFILSC